MKNYHAAIAASFVSSHSGICRDPELPCVSAAMRPGAPSPRRQDPAAKMVSADTRAVRAGQGKKIHPDQKTRAIIDVVRVVRAVRVKFSTSHTCAHARACVYRFLFYSFFFPIRESTLTTLTTSMMAGFFALTKHPDQA